MYFKGNIWAGNTKATIAFFLDERANQKQREALQMIFSGKAGGFMGELSGIIGDVRGLTLLQLSLKLQMTSLIGVLRFQKKY
jgi:hypothetical protein